MRKNYESMLNLLVSKKVFKKGEVINRNGFKNRIIELELREEFNKRYNEGYKDVLYWEVWDYNDRFKRFIKKCNIFECLGNGKYLVK